MPDRDRDEIGEKECLRLCELDVELVVIDDDRPGYEGGGIMIITRARISRTAIVDELTVDRSGVRVHDEFGGIESHAAIWFPRPVEPKAVTLAGADAGELSVPDVEGAVQ
jgi:hypothetical protein